MRVRSELTQTLAHVLELLRLCTSVTERRNPRLHACLSSAATHFLQKEPRVPGHRPQEEAPVHGGSAVAPEPPPAAPGSAPLPRAVAAAEVWVCALCLASAPGGRKETHMRAPTGLLLATNPLCFSSSLCEIRYNFGNRALSVNLPRA